MPRLHLARHSLESVCELLEKIFDDPLIVVAPAQNVVKSRETVCLTALFLMVELFGFKFVSGAFTPVVACGVHREARSERAVDTNDHGVLPCAAVPREVLTLHEIDHLPEAGVRI